MADYQSTHSGLTIDSRVDLAQENYEEIQALKARMDEAEGDLETKADATSVTAVNSRVGGVEAKIPSAASTSNKLVDKAYVDNALAGKVDVNGSKVLSTNDFTNDYKTKLDGLPTGLAISNALDGKASTSSVSDVSSRVTAVEGKIPSAATSSNQLADKAFVNNGLSGKQATLVSGSNIKTVNGESLVGSGNIIAGDPNAVKYVAQTLTSEQQAQARQNIGAASPNDLSGQYYGFYTSSSLLPTGMSITGYAFVGQSEPFSVWNYNGSNWSDSGVTVNAIEGEPGVGFDSVSTNQDGTLLITLSNGDTITVDLNHNHPQYAKYVYCQSQAEYDAITTKDSGTIYLILETE